MNPRGAVGGVRANHGYLLCMFKANLSFCFPHDWEVFPGMTDELSLAECDLMGGITSYQDATENVYLIG